MHLAPPMLQIYKQFVFIFHFTTVHCCILNLSTDFPFLFLIFYFSLFYFPTLLANILSIILRYFFASILTIPAVLLQSQMSSQEALLRYLYCIPASDCPQHLPLTAGSHFHTRQSHYRLRHNAHKILPQA